MARPKKQFTDAMNFTISQMVEINKTLNEIKLTLKKFYDFDVTEPTLSTHIKSLGYDKYDGRKKDSSNHHCQKSKIVESKEKSPSKYKLKKYYDGVKLLDKEEVKKIGLDKDGNPINFKIYYNKENEPVEVELLVNLNDSNVHTYSGGNDCEEESLRWWTIERMKFDMGDKYHPLLPGMIKGDWRGIDYHFKYDSNDCFRLDKSNVLHIHQEAWERYVDARYEYVYVKKLNDMDTDKYNVYLINMMNDAEILDMMNNAPDLIYKYMPTYLYSAVINYCIDEMDRQNRLCDRDDNRIQALKKIMGYCKTKESIKDYYSEKINLTTIKQCLFINPNDYDLVVKMIILNASCKGLIDKNYNNILKDIIMTFSVKSVETDLTLHGCDWLSVYDNKLHDAIFGREERRKKFCEKMGLVN